jgi:hypothetical protein
MVAPMSVQRIPAICDNCGTVYPSGFSVGGAGTMQMAGNQSGPCPACGGMGSVPDGFYEFTDDTIRIFSTWPPARTQRLAAALENARAAADPEAAIDALKEEPSLTELIKRLSPLRDASAFWAFIAVLLTVLNMTTASTNDPTITINQQTVIERVVTQSQPTVPGVHITTPPPTHTTKPPRAPATRATPRRKPRAPKTYGKQKRKRR